MTTPNVANSSLSMSQVNGELNYPTNTTRALNDMIVRELSGVRAKTVQNTTISFSDLSNKTAFGGLFSNSRSNTVNDFGSIQPTLTFGTYTDLLDANIVWSANVVSGWQGIANSQTNANNFSISLPLTNIGSATANVLVSVTVSYAGHLIGTANQYVTLTGTVYDPALTFTGNTNVNVQGYVAQTATTTLTASSNASNATISFTVTPNTGVSVSGNSVIFNVVAPTVTTDNTMVYTVQTNVNYKGAVIASNTQQITVRAVYNGADFNFVVPATSNNVFANNGPVTSTLSVAASHNIPGANIAWSYSLLSGANAVFTTDPTNANSTVTLTANDASFAKTICYVTATLQYANGYVLNTKTTQLTLRAGAYDLTVNPGANVALSGYNAQTATSTTTISWGAGTFSLAYALANGTTAVVSNTVTQNSASLSLTEYANTMGVTSAGVYTVTPIITYDGIVVSNTPFQMSVSAAYLPYTFNVSGPSSNTQIGSGIVNSSITLVGTHNVPNGVINWISTNANVAFTTNTSSATVSISSNTILTQNTTVIATLLDATGRTITVQQFPLILRAYAPNVIFNGANNVSVSGYAANQTAISSIAAVCTVPGANTFTLGAQKVSGNDLQIIYYTGNTSTDQITLEVSTVTGSIGTQSGTYQLQANVGYYGATYTATENVTVTATTLDPKFTLTPTGQSNTGYAPGVSSVGQVVASYVVPNGNVQWSYTGGTPTSFSSNSTVFSFTNLANNVGYSNINLNVTATLVDANNLFVASQTVSVNTSSQFIAPTPTLSGSTTVSTSNLFSSKASTSLTASTPTAIPGATFQFSTTLVSGTAPAVSTTANTISLSLSTAGSGVSSTCKINVTCNVIINNAVVASTTVLVTLTSSCPVPTMNYAAYANNQASYNYPIQAWGIAAANWGATPSSGEYIIISYSLASGPVASVSTTAGYFGSPSSSGSVNMGMGGNLYFNQQTSAVGATTSVYNITYQFYSPTGLLLNQQSNQVVVTAQRRDPGFSFNYGGGPSSVTATGWTQQGTVQAIVGMQAYQNSDVTNPSYSFNPQLVSGTPANFNYNNATGACNVQLISNGSAATSQYNISCTLYSNGQQIGGPITIPATCSVQPYYIAIASQSSTNGIISSSEYDTGGVTVYYTSNYPNFQNYFSYTLANTGTPSGTTYRSPQSGQGFTSPYTYVYVQYSPPPPSLGKYGCSGIITPYVAGVAGPQTPFSYQIWVQYVQTTCVGENMWLDDDYQAHQIVEGMIFDSWTPEDGFSIDFVKAVEGPFKVEVVRITTQSGAVLECSHNTPFNNKGSVKDMEDITYAADLLGKEVLVDIYGETFWEPVIQVEYLGFQNVYNISFGGKSYAAGADPKKKIYSHNKIAGGGG